MNKTLRKAMLSTIAMLVVGVMSLTGVTYAWFSAANTATVNNFTMTVDDNAGGIEIATTFGDWKSTVDGPDIASNTKFKAVSTVKALTDKGDLSFYTATLNPDNKAQIETAAADTGDYVKFTLYFRNNGSQPVAFNLAGTVITAASTNAGDDIVKAARVAFVDFGSQTIKGTSEDSATNFTAPTAASAIQIYEPEATSHTVNGIADGAKQNEVYQYLGVAGLTGGYVNRKEISTNLIAVETATALTDVQFTLSAGTYHKIDVYVWIEGQDPDCQNDVAGENLNVKLMFTKVGSENQ